MLDDTRPSPEAFKAQRLLSDKKEEALQDIARATKISIVNLFQYAKGTLPPDKAARKILKYFDQK